MFNKIYLDLIDKLNTGEDTVLLTHLKPIDNKSGIILNKYTLDRDSIENVIPPNLDQSNINKEMENSLITGGLQFKQNSHEIFLIEPYYPKPRLIIFGGGHIAKPLAEFASRVGFTVVVIDDRPSFANKHRFPEAAEIICDSFEGAFTKLKPRRTDFIVIVTRGHRHDELCLRRALEYKTSYLGMIGSKRRVKAMKEMLLKEGYSQETMDSVNSPIGLDIGAVTPDEIAIAIIAEVISYRRKRGGAKSTEKFNLPEFDEDVIHRLASDVKEPMALVTIISAKGSVPRKAGAKMLVWQDGKTLGSIGGGCSEANVIGIARDISETGGYIIHHVDMTGDVAEDEGMVCGGIMDVLIEAL